MFDDKIKRVAVQCGVLMFFVMAMVGWASGLSPCTAGARAGGGFIAVYCLVRLAGKLIINVLTAAAVNEKVRQHQKSNQEL